MSTERKHLWGGLALLIWGINALANQHDPHEILVFTAWFLVAVGLWLLFVALLLRRSS